MQFNNLNLSFYITVEVEIYSHINKARSTCSEIMLNFVFIFFSATVSKPQPLECPEMAPAVQPMVPLMDRVRNQEAMVLIA